MTFKTENIYGLIPNFYNPEINCLTPANLQEVGINFISYSLAQLLIKPGFTTLENLLSLSDFLPAEQFILNATLSEKTKDNDYVLKSQFDGQIFKFSQLQLLDLIIQLKPPALILPLQVVNKSDFAEKILQANIFPIVPISEFAEYKKLFNNFGIYYQLKELNQESINLLEQFKNYFKVVSGEFDQQELLQLKQLGVNFVECNTPITQAISGQLITSAGLISIQQEEFAQQFIVIDSKCACPTCKQNFTRAYLHYLFDHTPLLCQRLLIQHNLYFWQSY